MHVSNTSYFSYLTTYSYSMSTYFDIGRCFVGQYYFNSSINTILLNLLKLMKKTDDLLKDIFKFLRTTFFALAGSLVK